MEKKKPYFSVILPIYNVAPYLDHCIRSVLEQKFTDYELILVDDGSNDSCPEICDRYAEEYAHIRVIHKANGGLSSARNAGLEIARGEYIWWVDSDDWITQNALQVLYRVSADRPDMIKFPYFRAGEQISCVSCNVRAGIYQTAEELQQLQSQAFYKPGRLSLSAWSLVYKASFLRGNQLCFVSERIVGSEDYLHNLEAFSVAKRVRVTDVPLYYYRMREGSLTKRYRNNLAGQYAELYSRLCESFQKKGILDRFEEKICFFYVWHLVHGTYLAHEYRTMEGHPIRQGRKNVRKVFASDVFRHAIKNCEKNRLHWKQKIQLYAMLLGMEPLFYCLFVVKPGLKEGKNHEVKD